MRTSIETINYRELAYEQEFKRWMKDIKHFKSISSRITECKWVQKNGLLKLEEEFDLDGCEGLLSELKPQPGDQSRFARFIGTQKEDADKKTNLNSYYHAVRNYVIFMRQLRSAPYRDEASARPLS